MINPTLHTRGFQEIEKGLLAIAEWAGPSEVLSEDTSAGESVVVSLETAGEAVGWIYKVSRSQVANMLSEAIITAEKSPINAESDFSQQPPKQDAESLLLELLAISEEIPDEAFSKVPPDYSTSYKKKLYSKE
jgi:hypothetical protein